MGLDLLHQAIILKNINGELLIFAQEGMFIY
jgi:hypothetical protein